MKKFMMFTLIAVFGVAVLCAGGIKKAEALQIRLDDGTTPVFTISDGDAGDADGATGGLTWVGIYGDYEFNVEIGASKPVIGSSVTPQLTLTTTNRYNGDGLGTLEIYVTDTDFGTTSDSLIFSNSINSAYGGTQQVDYESWVDVDNDPFGEGEQIIALGPNSGIFDVSGLGSVTIDDEYSVTLKVTLTSSAAGQSQFDASLAAVPEPGTIALLGIGLAGLVGVGVRRRAKKNAA